MLLVALALIACKREARELRTDPRRGRIE